MRRPADRLFAFPSIHGGRPIEEFESPSALLFLPFLYLQGGGVMDLSKVGEKLLSSVRSATSLGLLPSVSSSDRPEVPARAAAAAAVARALAGIPPHQRYSLPSSSKELVSIYGSSPHDERVEELEENFYEEDFDSVRHVLENIPAEESDVSYFEKQSTLRLAQLDGITERLSHHVMEHHEEMVRGMQLVMELEQDLKVANVICMNGRRHLTSSMHEVSRDLIVNSYAKKKQALLDMLPVLTELLHATGLQVTLGTLVDNGNYFKAFEVFSEYLQVLENLSELSAIKEMGRGVEAWLARTLQKLDSLLLGVCREFNEDSYITVVDAYALLGDISGLAEKIQSFFMQEIISETHSVLKDILLENTEHNTQRNRLTYSDLCVQIPESKFRYSLLKTLDVLFKMMTSFYLIMSFQQKENVKGSDKQKKTDIPQSSEAAHPIDSASKASHYPCSGNGSDKIVKMLNQTSEDECSVVGNLSEIPLSSQLESHRLVCETSSDAASTGSSVSPCDQLRKGATASVAQALQRGRKNLWHLTTSRVSVLLSCAAVCSTSTHQFLKNYEDLSIFVLAGESFCGVQAVEFRQKLKTVCENYFTAFHRQNIHAMKMVLEKETWMKISPDAIQVISLAGLVGDGAPLIVSSERNPPTMSMRNSNKQSDSTESGQRNGFAFWVKNGSPFLSKLTCASKESGDAHPLPLVNGPNISHFTDLLHNEMSPRSNDGNNVNGKYSVSEDESEDLLADFIDEDSQLPSRVNKPMHSKKNSTHWNDEEISSQTGSSLCLLRLMDKYARLMQKLEIVNVEFFKGICHLFEIVFLWIYETFGQRDSNLSGKFISDSPSLRLKTSLTRIAQDCEQWIKPQTPSFSSPSAAALNMSFTQMDVTPTSPAGPNFGHGSGTSFGLKERCVVVETLSLVARILHRSKPHLQSMLLQHNVAMVEDFFLNLVDSVPDLVEHIYRTTARLLLHINGYVDRIANAKWEIKDLGLQHNGYVDLLLGEFKHYTTRLAHGGIDKEVQNLLLDYGLENIAETLIEGFSRIKRCTDEGRALMSLDLQVLISGLQHFVSINVKPKLQVVEAFIKAYYLPETEYVHWARSHPEYSKSQIVGLINMVATMKGWKRKTRLEIVERIELGS
ncbi:hypothetical protein QJS04_geneDACA000243 [Acorus gramineus]|uniref:Syndetin n=1 Tax=Acorus gramineus TaxID=55184 RepID=A0AAV9AT34_ACOGR|nr:hypothetical protein QJS04_geneDACA000243 [Acorus gramineus]